MNIKILKSKNLLLVILGQFASGFGTMMQSFALSLYVLKKTGSAALFSSVLIVSIIPRILLTPLAGAIADRFSRKKMIVIMDYVSAAIVAIFAALFLINGELNMLYIYILAIILSVINTFFSPSMSAIVPDIVQEKDLADANSVREMSNSLISLASPLVAGLLYASLGLFPIMVINAISFFASAVSEMFIKIKKESLMKNADKESYFESIKKGFTFAKSLPEIILMSAIAVFANFAIAPIFSVALPVVLLNDFGFSESYYGLFNSLITIGMILAPLVAAKIIKKHHYSKIVWSVLSFNGILCIIIAALSIKGLFPSDMINYISLIVVINVLIMTIIWVNLALSTAMQLLVPKDMMGRVFSVLGTFSMIASPLGFALMGFLLEFSKSYTVIGIYAFVLLIVGLLARKGFISLENKGKMDMTTGLELAEEEAA